MSWLLRTVLAGSGLLAGVAAGFFCATSLQGKTIDRPLSHAYQPLTAGATWTYEVRQRQEGSGELPASVVTERVSGIVIDGARVVADVEASLGSAAARPTHTIVLTREGILPELEVHSEGASLRAVSSRGVYLPAQMSPGMRWTYQVDFAADGAAKPSTVVAEMRAVGSQRLETPAGVFEVVHVRRELHSGAHAQTDDLYYARDVGLVAATTTTASGYRADRVLTRFAPAGP